MVETVIYDLKMIGCAILLLLVAWTANAILGTFYNIAIWKDSFDKKKLLSGVVKLLSVCAGTALVSIVISLLPVFLSTYGIQIQAEAMEAFSVIAIAGLYALTIVKYLKECVKKLTDILKSS